MFHMYMQNNSGGYFIDDEIATKYVIIEADTYQDANTKASSMGLFSYDWCECCGERFSILWKCCNEDVPKIYGEPVETYVDPWIKVGDIYARVFYKDGSSVDFIAK